MMLAAEVHLGTKNCDFQMERYVFKRRNDDGNVYAPENEAGVLQWLFEKSVTSIILQNKGSSDGIASPSLARIIPIDLAMFGGEMLCQSDAFLCSINDVKINNTLDPRALRDF